MLMRERPTDGQSLGNQRRSRQCFADERKRDVRGQRFQNDLIVCVFQVKI